MQSKFNLNELEIKWHNLTLERIFIEKELSKIQELDNWDDIIGTIHKSLLPFQNLKEMLMMKMPKD